MMACLCKKIVVQIPIPEFEIPTSAGFGRPLAPSESILFVTYSDHYPFSCAASRETINNQLPYLRVIEIGIGIFPSKNSPSKEKNTRVPFFQKPRIISPPGTHLK